MGFKRRVRKLLKEGQDPEPVYLFYPDKEKAGDIIHAILQNVPFDITVKIVTDDKLCKRIGEGISNAIATKQHSVMEGSKEKGVIILPEDFRK
jgi:hypothetical protein